MAFYSDYKAFGENILAVDNKGFSLTYAELSSLADKLGEVMEKRSLVMQFCSNTIGSLVGYLSFLHNGTVPIMIDKKVEDSLVNHLIETYKPAYLYLPEELTERIGAKEVLFSFDGYVLVKNDTDVKVSLYEELALLLTTSGSVGSPKLVRQSYKNIQSNADSIAEYLKIDDSERPVTTLPMNYTYGISIINSHVLKGATLLITDDTLVSKGFWQFMKEERATSFGGVPFTYEMLKKIRFFKMDLPHLKTMTQAGGKLSFELHGEYANYAKETGKQFIVMYGQTEATARMAYLPAEKAIEKQGSMGIAIPGGKLILIDTKGDEITEPDVVGEMVYEGDNVTLGYAESYEDLALGDERHGRLETGDMAKTDKDGYYYVVGRKKRFLKLYGNRVNLDDLERLVKAKFDTGCAAVGTDERCLCYVTTESILAEVEDFVSKTTHINPKAFKAIYIDDVPKNESGKTLYSKLPNTVE